MFVLSVQKYGIVVIYKNGFGALGKSTDIKLNRCQVY